MIKTYEFKKTEDSIEVPTEELDGEADLSAKEQLGLQLARELGVKDHDGNAQVENISFYFEKKFDDALFSEISTLKGRIIELEEQLKKAEHERDLLKEMMNGKPDSKKYKVRQIAILALALCRKAMVVPKNKKKIAVLFSNITGSSQNTISQNLCDTYTDEEIQEIAEPLKDTMPELAEYLLANKFAG